MSKGIHPKLVEAGRALKERGGPRFVLYEYILAQWCLESGWGHSELAVEYNNFGGLKYRRELMYPGCPYYPVDYIDWYERKNAIPKEQRDLDMACRTPNDYVQLYFAFLNRSRYDGWKSYVHDPEAFLSHLAKCGYCGTMDGVEPELVPVEYPKRIYKIMNSPSFQVLLEKIDNLRYIEEMPEWLRLA